jgi:hypothetical protein
MTTEGHQSETTMTGKRLPIPPSEGGRGTESLNATTVSFPPLFLDLLPYNPISGRDVKLRQQELDQINESFAPRSQASTQRHAVRLQSAALDTTTSIDSSASLNENMITAQQTSTSLNTFWDVIIRTPSFLESAIDAEDFEGLSLMSSTQESAVAT